jgi:polysaccharide export outer membrane protein
VDLTQIEMTRFVSLPEAGTTSSKREFVNASLTGLDGIQVGPGDVVRLNGLFRDREIGSVSLVGEFVRTGTYDIRRDERLSQVIARAGGLTSLAYPYGAIFTRVRVKRAEEASLQRLARELSSAVSVAAVNSGIDAAGLSAFAQLTSDIGSAPATGRVVIEADPTVLQVRPELDVVLQPGDRIFLPKRPSSVLVTGEVLNPGAMQFISGRGVDDYVKLAGGFRQTADRNRLFVVFPNGAAQPISVSPFNFTSIQVPPGSAIVVPTDATPFNLLTVAREISSVLSQLAITAASLAVISNN